MDSAAPSLRLPHGHGQGVGRVHVAVAGHVRVNGARPVASHVVRWLTTHAPLNRSSVAIVGWDSDGTRMRVWRTRPPPSPLAAAVDEVSCPACVCIERDVANKIRCKY